MNRRRAVRVHSGLIGGHGEAAVVVVAAAAGGAAYRPAFAPSSLLILVALAAVVPAVLLRTRRVTPWAVPLLGTVLLAVFVFGRDTGPFAAATWRELVDGLSSGAWRLFTITLPAPARPDLLVVPAALTWLASSAGVALLTRTRARVVAILPALVTAASALLLIRQPDPLTLGALGVQAVAFAVLLASGSTMDMRGAVVALGTVLLLMAGTGVAVTLGPTLGRPVPLDIHEIVAASVRGTIGVSPLDRLGGWRTTDQDRILFHANTTGTASGTVPAWRLAVLDSYDGQAWGSTDRFRPAGLGVSPALPAADPGPVTTQSVTIDGLDGPLLPTVDRLVWLDPAADTPITAVAPESAMLLSDTTFAPGLSYQVSSRVVPRHSGPDPGLDDASAATAAAPLLAVPDELRAQLTALASATPPGPVHRRVLALIEDLRARHRNVDLAPPSTTIAGIQDFLRPDAEGSTVQFVETFALAVRTLSIPSRLVVGFDPGGAGGTYSVRGRDATVWAELAFAGVGWVRFDPAPPVEPGQVAPRPLPPPPPVPVDLPPPPPDDPPGPGPSSAPVDWSRWFVRVVMAVVMVVVLVVAGYLVAVSVGPTIRRSVRRLPLWSPRARVAAAWHEALDLYALTGPPLEAATPLTVVARLSTLGRSGHRRPSTARIVEANAELGTVADQALFGVAPVTAADAARAWRRSATLRRALLSRLGRGQRLAWFLSPRRLSWRSRWP